MSAIGACVKILYSIVGGKEQPPSLNRRWILEAASIREASLGLIHFSKSIGLLPSLAGKADVGSSLYSEQPVFIAGHTA